jgi:L-ascorbate metabolism protein UlaG (beta-lactamase superfamily)
MKITKFGHCCLLIEENGARILTDPGNYNATPHPGDLDAILLTHEHQDHVHVESLREVILENPKATVYTHVGVGKILEDAALTYTIINDGEEVEVKGIPVASFGTEHACICQGLPNVQNTGFYIANKLFYPGDAFHNPNKPIEVLALPVAGPWMKLEEAIDYAKAIKPKVVFPVHDGMLRQEHQLGPTRRIPKMMLEPLGIEYRDMGEGSVENF